MAGGDIDPRIIEVAIEALPGLIEWLRNKFRTEHPDAPELTDAEVVAAYNAAYQSSLAKDDAWLVAHPNG